MFNPYYARPIGSDKFLNHLLSIMTEKDEIRREELEALPKIPVHLRRDQDCKVTFDPVMEGYKALANAILVYAIIDYLDEYECRLRLEDKGRESLAYVHECRCLSLENDYFRDDEDYSALLDCILRYVIHNREDQGKLKWRLERIMNAKKRLTKIVHDC